MNDDFTLAGYGIDDINGLIGARMSALGVPLSARDDTRADVWVHLLKNTQHSIDHHREGSKSYVWQAITNSILNEKRNHAKRTLRSNQCELQDQDGELPDDFIEQAALQDELDKLLHPNDLWLFKLVMLAGSVNNIDMACGYRMSGFIYSFLEKLRSQEGVSFASQQRSDLSVSELIVLELLVATKVYRPLPFQTAGMLDHLTFLYTMLEVTAPVCLFPTWPLDENKFDTPCSPYPNTGRSSAWQ